MTSTQAYAWAWSACLVVAACSVSGCATLFESGPDPVPVISRPAGAMVFLDGHPVGRTPVVVRVPRNIRGSFRLELEGYEPVTAYRSKVLNVWAIAGIFLAGMTSVIVDGITNNFAHLPSDELFLELRGVGADGAPARPALIPLTPAP